MVNESSCDACPGTANWTSEATSCGSTSTCCLDGVLYTDVDSACCGQIGGHAGSCCGNGVTDAGEECDGEYFCGADCKVVHSIYPLLTATGACCVDSNQDGTWGDLCVDGETPSECFSRKADPAHVLWHRDVTCNFLSNCSGVGAANTTGTCCLLDGFNVTANDNLTFGECVGGAFEPGISANESACIQCVNNSVCDLSGCDETYCNTDTLLCECVTTPSTPPTPAAETSTPGLTTLSIVLIAVVSVLSIVALVTLGLAVGYGQRLSERERFDQQPDENEPMFTRSRGRHRQPRRTYRKRA